MQENEKKDEDISSVTNKSEGNKPEAKTKLEAEFPLLEKSGASIQWKKFYAAVRDQIRPD